MSVEFKTVEARYEVFATAEQVDEYAENMAGEVIEKVREFGSNVIFVVLREGGIPIGRKLEALINQKETELAPQFYDLRVSTYGDSQESKEPVISESDLPHEIVEGNHVFIIDDLIDEGGTAIQVTSHMRKLGATGTTLVALCQKDNPARRINADIYGTMIPNMWAAGMGMNDDDVEPEFLRDDPRILLVVNPTIGVRQRPADETQLATL